MGWESYNITTSNENLKYSRNIFINKMTRGNSSEKEGSLDGIES
jgi:hypothetical protein